MEAGICMYFFYVLKASIVHPLQEGGLLSRVHSALRSPPQRRQVATALAASPPTGHPGGAAGPGVRAGVGGGGGGAAAGRQLLVVGPGELLHREVSGTGKWNVLILKRYISSVSL